MPSRLAASITVVPFWTSISVPSTVTYSMALCCPALTRVQRRSVSAQDAHQTGLVVDVVLELIAEMRDEALHRQRGRIAQRADGATGDVVGHVGEQVEVLVPALAVLDPVHHPVQPARSL